MGASPVMIGAASVWPRVMRGVWGGQMSHSPCPVTGGRPVPNIAAGEGVCITSTARFLTVAVLCLVVAIGLQVASNFFNDYADGVRGTDEGRAARDVSPVGAPSRLVASGTNPRSVLRAALSAVAVAVMAGVAVVVLTGHVVLLVVGALSAIMAWKYSGGRRPWSHRGWGEGMAFLFYGPIACVGTQWALMGGLGSLGGLDPSNVILSIVPGCCAACLMMVNNLRDCESDKAVGKRTLMVRMGRRHGSVLFAVVMAVAVAIPLLFFQSFELWTQLEWTGFGVASSDARLCDAPSVTFAVCFWLVVVLLCGLVVLAAGCIRAVWRERWPRAFRLCAGVSAMSSLIVALCALFA